MATLRNGEQVINVEDVMAIRYLVSLGWVADKQAAPAKKSQPKPKDQLKDLV
jgi:hypothetical protein